jgi:hypothetical protein
MPDTRKLKDFIKMSDLDEGDIITFSDAGKLVERDFAKQGEDPDLKVVLEMNVALNDQEPKKMTINNSTINILNEKWTRITENWVGKRAKAEKRKIQSFGKWIDIVVLEPMADEPPPAPTPVDPDPVAEQPQAPLAEPAKDHGDYCGCGSEAKGVRTEINGQIMDICQTCKKPVIAWDE